MKYPAIDTILRNIAYLSDLLPLILYIFFAKSRRNIALRVVFFLVVYSLFVNLVVTSNIQVQERYFVVVRITTIVIFSLFAYLFYHLIEPVLSKRIILIVSSITGLYLIFELFTSSSDAEFDSVPSGITSLIILVYSILYLFDRVKDTDALFFYSSPNFWVVVSIIIYAAGTFFPFIYAKNYLSEQEFTYEFDLIHDTLYIIKNIIFAIAMLAKDKPEQSKYLKKKKKT
ncbi:MAG: hypothetical protein ACTHLE_02155 [Agriterribacter sp.]